MSADEKVDAANVTAKTVDSESGPGSGEVIAISSGDQPTFDELSAALRDYVPGTALEKKLVRKLDLTLLPCLWWVYILAYLDRGNIVCVPLPLLSSPCSTNTSSRAMPTRPV